MRSLIYIVVGSFVWVVALTAVLWILLGIGLPTLLVIVIPFVVLGMIFNVYTRRRPYRPPDYWPE
jgi:hypothetical protein